MFGTYFYHQISRKMVVAFGSLFNTIEVRRTNSAGSVIETLKVPLAYGPKEKFLTRISADPNLKPGIALTVPRMGFELTALTYDGVRTVSYQHMTLPTYAVGKIRWAPADEKPMKE